MIHKIRSAVLLLVLVFLVPGGQLGRVGASTPTLAALASVPTQPASVTVPGAEAPVVVPGTGSLNTRGWDSPVAAVAGAGHEDLAGAVLLAYQRAAAAAPEGCRLPVSLLAAIGQVESANLAGRVLDANHRVVPALLGPVLDGHPFLAVPDTDAGAWDGNRVWDRALGPLQLIPATWRVVGLDMDGDGQRDPQDIDDAAGAAMVYLCAGGRDLASSDGLREAVLSYNHSTSYLDEVMAWKAVFDTVDLGGVASLPMFDARALGSLTASPESTVSSPASGVRPRSEARGPRATATARPSTARPTATSPTTSAGPTSASSPSAGPSTGTGGPAAPAAAPPPSIAPDPTPTAGSDPSPDPVTDPGPSPAPLPTCPLPTPAEVGAPVPSAPPSTDVTKDAVLGEPTLDDQGDPCVPLLDPDTGLPILSDGTVLEPSQTRSADPGTP